MFCSGENGQNAVGNIGLGEILECESFLHEGCYRNQEMNDEESKNTVFQLYRGGQCTCSYFPVLRTIFSPKHWLFSHITTVETTESGEQLVALLMRGRFYYIISPHYDDINCFLVDIRHLSHRSRSNLSPLLTNNNPFLGLFMRDAAILQASKCDMRKDMTSQYMIPTPLLV